MNKNNMPEYRAWKSMKARCYAPCNKNMGKYRERNITVCDKWLNDFDAFFQDMGVKPSPKHSLDRIDTTKGYSPENCRWTTQDIQCKNRGSFNLIFTHEGESLVLKDWARRFNIKYGTLYQRIYRQGMSFADAIKKDPNNRMILINGEEKILKDWCRIYDRKYQTVVGRIHEGWDKVTAILTKTPCNFNNIKTEE